MYALNVGESNEILSAAVANKFTPPSMPRVDVIPDDDITDYDYTVDSGITLNESRRAERIAQAETGE